MKKSAINKWIAEVNALFAAKGFINAKRAR
jgi:hypothetical protein